MTEAEQLEKTPLHSEHAALDGKMVPFAGYSMPVHYPPGIQAEHRAVRERAGLFDVSHMGELEVRGGEALELVQKVTVNDASGITPGRAQYSALCREDGGVLDDILVYRLEDGFMLVVNAANREKGFRWLRKHSEGLDVQVDDRSAETALLALQGPMAQTLLAEHTPLDLDAIGFYRFDRGPVEGVEGIVSRTGYTGEDGFELYLPAEEAGTVWRALLTHGEDSVLPAGLGARDTLRLEAGLPLYGNDLDEEHTPVEAGLGWIVKEKKGEFVGRGVLARQKREGVERKLTGVRLEERGFPRPGYPVLVGGAEAGSLTSGTVSPSLGYGIGLAYLPVEASEPDTPVEIRVRKRELSGRTCALPFYTEGSLRR